MSELLSAVLSMALSVTLPYAITRWDRARLDHAARARAWNNPSWASAVYFFGPLCLPAHFWITRRSARGALIGILWMVGVLGCELLVEWTTDALG